MGKNNIEEYSTGYAILKTLLRFWHNKVYYRKVIVIGKENINPNEHIIFAPNHQNALMDALAVLFTHKGQPVFLARADLFKKKAIAAMLYFLKMLPVYRIRDGYATLKENDAIFSKTVDVIKNKNGLVILPEGNHGDFKRLRELKKGICRIAFQADKAENNQMKIKIIPVGIEYSYHRRFRQVLTVVYGKPLEVSQFHELYMQNPDKALLELKKSLSDEMKKLIIHIESEEDYEAIDELRSIVNGKFSDSIKEPKLFRDRNLIDKLNNLKNTDFSLYKRVCSLSLSVKENAKRFKLDYRLVEKKKHSLFWLLAGCVVLVIGFPVFLFGNIFNAVFMGIPIWQARNVKDPQFISSLRYGVSVGLALLLFLPTLILSLIFFPEWWEGLLFFISLPISGLAAWNYYLFYKRICGGFRIRKLISSKNKQFETLNADYKELMSIIAKIQHEI